MSTLKTSPLRLGILGCGSFVQRRILPALEQVDAIKVVCLQKRDLGEARRLAAQFQIPYAVARREDLLKHPEVDAVFIATANHLHEEDALACAAAHKPTLCEKPLAPTTEAIEAMLAAFQREGVPLFVGHSLRFKPSVQKARQLVQDGVLGKILHMRAYYYASSVSKNNWRWKKELGGGVVQDVGVHLIDLIRFVSGEEIESVYALANRSSQPDSGEAEATVSALFRLSGGGSATLECSFERPYQNGFEIVGTKSRLLSIDSLRQTLDPIEGFCHIQEDGSKLHLPLQATDIYAEELKHFADMIGNPSASLIPATIGLHNQRVVEEIYRSLALQQETQPSTP